MKHALLTIALVIVAIALYNLVIGPMIAKAMAKSAA